MRLTPEERKALARDLLVICERFDAELGAVLLKHGMNPEALDIDFGALRELLQQEIDA